MRGPGVVGAVDVDVDDDGDERRSCERLISRLSVARGTVESVKMCCK